MVPFPAGSGFTGFRAGPGLAGYSHGFGMISVSLRTLVSRRTLLSWRTLVSWRTVVDPGDNAGDNPGAAVCRPDSFNNFNPLVHILFDAISRLAVYLALS